MTQAKPKNEPNAPFFVDREVIILTKNGVWMADGVEISHEPTRKLFARSLKRDTDGYQLHIGRETKRIQVEDTAYFVLRIDGSAKSGYELLLNDETRERLDPSTLSYRPGRLICQVKEKSEDAKFLHSAYFDLLKDLEENSQEYYLSIGDGSSKTKIRLAKK